MSVEEMLNADAQRINDAAARRNLMIQNWNRPSDWLDNLEEWRWHPRPAGEFEWVQNPQAAAYAAVAEQLRDLTRYGLLINPSSVPTYTRSQQTHKMTIEIHKEDLEQTVPTTYFDDAGNPYGRRPAEEIEWDRAVVRGMTRYVAEAVINGERLRITSDQHRDISNTPANRDALHSILTAVAHAVVEKLMPAPTDPEVLRQQDLERFRQLAGFTGVI